MKSFSFHLSFVDSFVSKRTNQNPARNNKVSNTVSHLYCNFLSRKNSIKVITRKLINDSMTYAEYRQLVDDLYDDSKTTGENHSESMLNYTKMNIQRMKRLDKKITLKDSTVEAVSGSDKKQIWLTLTEGWCGDAAQILPVLNKIAEQNPNIDSRYILRDKHLDVMDQFLTNGSRSIPKTIVLDAETLDILDTWGPRPKELQEYFLAERQKEGYKWSNVSTELQRWYNKDKTKTIQQELADLVD